MKPNCFHYAMRSLCWNHLKSLSGIETICMQSLPLLRGFGLKSPKIPIRDWNYCWDYGAKHTYCWNHLKSLSGIETTETRWQVTQKRVEITSGPTQIYRWSAICRGAPTCALPIYRVHASRALLVTEGRASRTDVRPSYISRSRVSPDLKSLSRIETYQFSLFHQQDLRTDIIYRKGAFDAPLLMVPHKEICVSPIGVEIT